MKKTLVLATLSFLAVTSPAISETQQIKDYELRVAVRMAAELTALTEDDIKHPEMDDFFQARADLNALLMRDPDHPAVSEWIRGDLDRTGWLAYGPPTMYLITAHEPLPIDQAFMFRKFLAGVLEFDYWNADDGSACLGVKALHLLKNGPASPEEEAYLNAFFISAEIERLAMRSDSYRRAMRSEPQFFATADQDEETLSAASVIDSAKSAMLWKAAVFDEALNVDMIENDIWIDPMTGKEDERRFLDQALEEAAGPEYQDWIVGSRPFFAYIEAEREKGAAEVVRALCE